MNIIYFNKAFIKLLNPFLEEQKKLNNLFLEWLGLLINNQKTSKISPNKFFIPLDSTCSDEVQDPVYLDSIGGYFGCSLRLGWAGIRGYSHTLKLIPSSIFNQAPFGNRWGLYLPELLSSAMSS